MKFYNLLFVVFLFGAGVFAELSAQNIVRLLYPTEKDGKMLKYAWAGGLNAPQFSEIDFDQDGVKDLFVFDRFGNAMLTFKNNGTPGSVDYEFTPYAADRFPNLYNWTLLRDYNGDGLEDIFTYSQGIGASGFSVYTTNFDGNNLEFDLFQFNWVLNLMVFDQGGGVFTNVYVSPEDYPAVVDVDGDGDLDVLTFDSGGTFVFYYQNQSVEKGYGLDSLTFTLEDICWGKFKESGLSADVILSDDPQECAEGIQGGGGNSRHAGSTLLAFDDDNDGDLEMILGDLFNEKLTYLKNNGSSEDAFMTEQDTEYPSNDTEVSIPIFNSAFYLDVNNDGKKDLLAAPNGSLLIEDVKGVWRYDNVGTAQEPEFNFEEDGFLVDEMLDFGTGGNPTFVDYNADGKLDVVVGNSTYFVPGGVKQSQLALLENVGTEEEPAFRLVDLDWLGFSTFSGSNAFDFSPTFGDIDSDGDLDLLVGEQQGGLFFAENIAGPGNPLDFGPVQYPYMGIDRGQASTPQIIDLDRDGLMDIVVGERLGILTFFKNTGSAGNPQFNPNADESPNISKLGNVDTRGIDPTKGYAAPAFVDLGDEYVLFSGSDRGSIYYYENIDGNLEGDFTEVTTFFGNIREGFRTHPNIADVNNDGVLDMVIGNLRGGVSMYNIGISLDGEVNTENLNELSLDLKVYPNPVNDVLNVEVNTWANYRIVNLIGLEVRSGRLAAGLNQVYLSDLSKGVYFVEVSLGTTYETIKLIKR